MVQINQYKFVSDIPAEFMLYQTSSQFQGDSLIMGAIGLENDHMGGFVSFTNDGSDIAQIWAFSGQVPHMNKTVTLIYDSVAFDSILECWRSIPAEHRTSRYPKHATTFLKTVWVWLCQYHPNTPNSDIARFCAIVAFNKRWIKSSALTVYGIHPESLWLDRNFKHSDYKSV